MNITYHLCYITVDYCLFCKFRDYQFQFINKGSDAKQTAITCMYVIDGKDPILETLGTSVLTCHPILAIEASICFTNLIYSISMEGNCGIHYTPSYNVSVMLIATFFAICR